LLNKLCTSFGIPTHILITAPARFGGITTSRDGAGINIVCELDGAHVGQQKAIWCVQRYVRLRVFENRVLRVVFGPKMDEVTGEWRKLHNKELYDLSSLNVIWVI